MEEHGEGFDLLRQVELIAAKGRDTGFDSARADGDQEETDPCEEFDGNVQDGNGAKSQEDATECVDHGEVQDGAVLAQPAIGEDRTEEREEVDETGEDVEDVDGTRLVVVQFVAQVQGEDRWAGKRTRKRKRKGS